MIAFAAMLFLASVAAWLICANPFLRFACVLYAALALSTPMNLTASVALVVSALAPAMLALSLGRVPFAAPVLAVATIAGFAAALTGITVLAFAPLLISALAIAVARRRSPQAMAAALALLAGAASFAAGSIPALLAFSSAAVLGLALQASVEEHGVHDAPTLGIGRAR